MERYTEYHFRVWGADVPDVLRHLATARADLPLDCRLGDTVKVHTRHDGVIEMSTTPFPGLVAPMPDRWLVVCEYWASSRAYTLRSKEVWRGAVQLFSSQEFDGRGTVEVDGVQVFDDWIYVRDPGGIPSEQVEIVDAGLKRRFHDLVAREYGALAVRLGDDARVLTEDVEERFEIEAGTRDRA